MFFSEGKQILQSTFIVLFFIREGKNRNGQNVKIIFKRTGGKNDLSKRGKLIWIDSTFTAIFCNSSGGNAVFFILLPLFDNI